MPVEKKILLNAILCKYPENCFSSKLFLIGLWRKKPAAAFGDKKRKENMIILFDFEIFIHQCLKKSFLRVRSAPWFFLHRLLTFLYIITTTILIPYFCSSVVIF